ncbi:MAG: hypothetical protein L0Z62_03745 [Gemmataceae bacterium]|nr:hypothetical protein [Gemmataceae bacterium]
MISWKGDDHWAPTPEQLAAYADGELDCPELASLKQRIESWLARHPEAATEVESQRQLTALWQATTPPEPSAAAWAGVQARLQSAPLAPKGAPRRSLHLVACAAAALAAGAAAVWLLVAFLRPTAQPDLARQQLPQPQPRQGPAKPPEPRPEPVQPFPVASADEVEILSIHGEDRNTLVNRFWPVSTPLVLLLPGEAEITRAEREVRMGGSGSPMIWTPLDEEREGAEDDQELGP